MKPFNRYIVTYFSDVFNRVTTVTMYAQSSTTAHLMAEWVFGMKRVKIEIDNSHSIFIDLRKKSYDTIPIYMFSIVNTMKVCVN